MELLDAMRTTLLRVPMSIVKSGRQNARQSEPFLVKRDAKPKHVLHNLAQSMRDAAVPFIDVERLQKETKREVRERWNQYIKPTVQGRQNKIWLLPDGTMKQYRPDERKQPTTFASSLVEQAGLKLKQKHEQLYPSKKESDTASSVVRVVSGSSPDQGLHPSAESTFPSNLHLSSEQEGPGSISSGSKVNFDEGFEYLLGIETGMPSVQHPEAVRDADEPESRKVILEWPPRGPGDDLEASIQGDTSDADEFRASIDLIEEKGASSLEPSTKIGLRTEPAFMHEVIQWSEEETIDNDEISGGSSTAKVPKKPLRKWGSTRSPGNKGRNGP